MLAAPTRVFCHPHDGKHPTAGLALPESNENHPRQTQLAAFKCRDHALTASFTEQMPVGFEKSRLAQGLIVATAGSSQ